jgi:hypothetical protein
MRLFDLLPHISSYPSFGRRHRQRREYDAGRPVVFFHVPKTSGSAVTAGLIAALSPQRFLVAYDRAVYGSFEGFDSMAPEVKSNLYLDARDLPPGSDFVAGHCAFSTFWAKYSEAQFVSFLREPVSRLLSFWLFWRAYTDDDLAPWGLWGDKVRLSRKPLQDFLGASDIACHTDNLLTRLLLWPDPLIPDGDFIDHRNDKTVLAKAKSRLNQFAYVDVIENPQFMQSLAAWLGRPVNYPLVNETKATPAQLTMPLHEAFMPDAMGLLDERTRLDLPLWKVVAEQMVASPDVGKLRDRTLMLNVARHSQLLMRHAIQQGPG